MAPKSSPLPSSSSQKTKQQSISSFFAPKPSPVVKAAPAKPESSPTNGATTEAQISLSDDEDSLPAPCTSHLGHKRVVDDSDNEQEDNGRSSPKRARLAASNVWNDTNEGAPRASLVQASSADVNAAKRPKASERTSKYLFSSSPVAGDENEGEEEDTAAAKQRKEELHRRFVKKLGRPDSFAELRRRNKIIPEDTADGQEGDEEDVEEDAPKPTKGRKGTASKRAGKLTPMQQQYLDLKRKHLDTILVVEVGYKFQIYGEDARIASKELGIVCIPGKFKYDERQSQIPSNALVN